MYTCVVFRSQRCSDAGVSLLSTSNGGKKKRGPHSQAPPNFLSLAVCSHVGKPENETTLYHLSFVLPQALHPLSRLPPFLRPASSSAPSQWLTVSPSSCLKLCTLSVVDRLSFILPQALHPLSGLPCLYVCIVRTRHTLCVCI